MELDFTKLIALREVLSHHVLFTLGAMMLIGYVVGVLAGKVKLPEITGFIVAGIVVGEYGLGIVPLHMTASMKGFTEIALGLIALTIGSEFSFFKIKRMGKAIVWITISQIVVTFALVLPVMRLVGMPLPFALIVAAIGTASSPAVAVAVVQSLRARGAFVDHIYGVVALLDAGAVILFGICFSIAVALLGLTPSDSGSVAVLGAAVAEVVYSLLSGIAVGWGLHWVLRRKTRPNEILLITLSVVLLVIAVATVMHLSPLLINMTAGAVMINLSNRHHRTFRILEPLTPPIYALFFVLAGSELQIHLLMQPTILWFSGAYMLSRAAGKLLSVPLGALIAGADRNIRSNLGFCMLPEAGVSLGLVLLVQASPLSQGMTPAQVALTDTMVNTILIAVFINQFVGPPLTKLAILRGNDMEEQEWKS